MSDRYPGGIIVANPTAPTTTSAPGIWTLEQASYYIGQGTWPLPPPPPDTYFDYVTLLLNGDGTNGAQNNTFLDSSTNAFSITRNGNTTQGSFSPYGSLWSNYFNGTNSYFDSPNVIALGSGDFTVEGWFNPSNTTACAIYDFRGDDTGMAGNDPVIQWSTVSAGKFTVRMNGTYAITTSSTFAVGGWYHVALVRNSGVCTLYVNGVSEGTYSTNTNFTTAYIRVGAYGGDGTFKYTGYCSNLRAVVGTAVYTAAFTPPTTPLTAISGTIFLTCQSNRFIDNSSNNYTLTITGTPSVQRFSPFNPTASYSTATIGGSGYFDGSGDYLTAPYQSINFGTGDFTVEGWFYTSNSSSVNIIGSGQSGTNYFVVAVNSDGSMSLYATTSGGGTAISSATGLWKLNQWNYFNIKRTSGTVTVNVNGTAGSGSSNTINLNNTSYPFVLGGYSFSEAGRYSGYVSNLRLSNIARSSYAVPTSPLTTDANTTLLMDYTNAGIPDSAMMNDLETVGNAQVSTSVKKFGTGSLAFDGTGDGLRFATTPQVYFGTGDFTIECWTYINSNQAYAMLIDATGAGGANTGWFVEYSATRGLVFYYGTGSSQGSVSYATTPPTSTWQHIAVCRSSGTVYLYINGVSVASGSVSTIGNATSSSGSVGASLNASDYYFNGYIDDLRVTKGYARYPSGTTFTPPTTAFPTY